jgi:chemotaxis protein histidine kinase CheA
VISLKSLFASKSSQPSNPESRSFIVIRELKDGVAFEVDDFCEFETHVIQDFLEGHFDDVPFDGASVMGDGSICLILSIDKVLAKANLAKTDQIGGRSMDVESMDKISSADKEHCVLVIQPSEEKLCMSIDMSWVSRIETFSEGSLKRLKGTRI